MLGRKSLKKPAAKGGTKSRPRTTRSKRNLQDDEESAYGSNIEELEIEEFKEVTSGNQVQNPHRLRERGNRVTRRQKAQEKSPTTGLPVNEKENQPESVTAISLYHEPLMEQESLKIATQTENMRLLFTISPMVPFL